MPANRKTGNAALILIAGKTVPTAHEPLLKSRPRTAPPRKNGHSIPRRVKGISTLFPSSSVHLVPSFPSSGLGTACPGSSCFPPATPETHVFGMCDEVGVFASFVMDFVAGSHGSRPHGNRSWSFCTVVFPSWSLGTRWVVELGNNVENAGIVGAGLPATRKTGNAPLTLIAGKPAPTGDWPGISSRRPPVGSSRRGRRSYNRAPLPHRATCRRPALGPMGVGGASANPGGWEAIAARAGKTCPPHVRS